MAELENVALGLWPSGLVHTLPLNQMDSPARPDGGGYFQGRVPYCVEPNRPECQPLLKKADPKRERATGRLANAVFLFPELASQPMACCASSFRTRFLRSGERSQSEHELL